MKAMILAAGYGTRLRPLTYSVPKPMVPVCNRPLIGYAVENFLRYGVKEIVVNLHHLPEILEQYLTKTYGGQCKFHFSFEPEILGTGGGIRKVRPLLEKEEEFFLVNGDTIQIPPFDALREARRAKNAIAALTLRHPLEQVGPSSTQRRVGHGPCHRATAPAADADLHLSIRDEIPVPVGMLRRAALRREDE